MPRAQSILPIDGSMKLSVLPMMEREVDLFCWGRLHSGKIPQMYEAKSPSQFPKADHERCLVESFYKALVLWDIEINVWSGCIFKLELSNGLTPPFFAVSFTLGLSEPTGPTSWCPLRTTGYCNANPSNPSSWCERPECWLQRTQNVGHQVHGLEDKGC